MIISGAITTITLCVRVFSFYLCGSRVESAIQEKEPCVGLGSECGSARIEISRGICYGSD